MKIYFTPLDHVEVNVSVKPVFDLLFYSFVYVRGMFCFHSSRKTVAKLNDRWLEVIQLFFYSLMLKERMRHEALKVNDMKVCLFVVYKVIWHSMTLKCDTKYCLSVKFN